MRGVEGRDILDLTFSAPEDQASRAGRRYRRRRATRAGIDRVFRIARPALTGEDDLPRRGLPEDDVIDPDAVRALRTGEEGGKVEVEDEVPGAIGGGGDVPATRDRLIHQEEVPDIVSGIRRTPRRHAPEKQRDPR